MLTEFLKGLKQDLVVRGFTQQQDVDDMDTFALVFRSYGYLASVSGNDIT